MLLLALLATMPMRFALGLFGLDRAGLSVRSAEGTLWSATLRGVQFGDIQVGDVYAGVSPWRLMTGETRLLLWRPALGGAPALGLAIGNGLWGTTLEGRTASLPTGAVFAPLPIAQLDLAEVAVRFVGNRCAAAHGRVTARLAGDVAGIALAQGLSGTARCAGGALELPLASQAGTERATLTLYGDGRFRATFEVTPAAPEIAARLAATGFQAVGPAYRLSAEGRF